MHKTVRGAFQIGGPLHSLFQNGLRNTLDFIYPPICQLCDDRTEDGRWLCPSCWKRIRESSRVVLQRNPEEFQYLSEEPFFDGIFTCWEFNADLEQLIHQMKYSQMKNLARFFGKTAGEMLASCLNKDDFQIILSLPLHKVRQRERGYNQSEWIGAGLSEWTGIPILSKILLRKKYTQTQTGLSGEARQENVSDAFEVRHPERVRNLSVLIVDDVVTTGATMNACARSLKEAGAALVFGLALARPVMVFECTSKI